MDYFVKHHSCRQITRLSLAEDSIKRLLSLANKDCYTVLGVTPDANQADIKKVYRQQAILVHPDKTQHPGADAAFKILAQAFETVGDPEKRNVSWDVTRFVDFS